MRCFDATQITPRQQGNLITRLVEAWKKTRWAGGARGEEGEEEEEKKEILEEKEVKRNRKRWRRKTNRRKGGEGEERKEGRGENREKRKGGGEASVGRSGTSGVKAGWGELSSQSPTSLITSVKHSAMTFPSAWKPIQIWKELDLTQQLVWLKVLSSLHAALSAQEQCLS